MFESTPDEERVIRSNRTTKRPDQDDSDERISLQPVGCFPPGNCTRERSETKFVEAKRRDERNNASLEGFLRHRIISTCERNNRHRPKLRGLDRCNRWRWCSGREQKSSRRFVLKVNRTFSESVEEIRLTIFGIEQTNHSVGITGGDAVIPQSQRGDATVVDRLDHVDLRHCPNIPDQNHSARVTGDQ